MQACYIDLLIVAHLGYTQNVKFYTGDLNSFLQVFFRPTGTYVNLILRPFLFTVSILQRAIPDEQDDILLAIPQEFCLPSIKEPYVFQP